MPIGKPLYGYTAYILDPNLEPVADGQTGELHIGGPALARGYLNRPELTDKAFISWQNEREFGSTQTLYKTGDLARWMDDGNIEFAGRIDHQIKLGSYRIEPGEIEEAINQHPDVRESLITFDEIDGKKYLIAYVVHGEQQTTAKSVADFLRENLPPYMVPARYIFLDSFPKTINGKVDRAALPSPDQSVTPRSRDLAAPENDFQKELCLIWADVLNIPEIGIHDDLSLIHI